MLVTLEQGCPTRGPSCYLVWPALRLKLLKNYVAELNVLFSLICWSSLEPLNVYIYVYSFLFNVKDVHYSFSKNINLHKIYYISGRWRREEGRPPQ